MFFFLRGNITRAEQIFTKSAVITGFGVKSVKSINDTRSVSYIGVWAFRSIVGNEKPDMLARQGSEANFKGA